MSRILLVLAIVLAVVVTQTAPEGMVLPMQLDQTAAALDGEALEPQLAPELPQPSTAPVPVWRDATHLAGRLDWCDIFRPPSART